MPAECWHTLTAFQRDTRTVIATLTAAEGHRPYGLSIRDRLETLYDETVNHGRLYPNLDTLVEAGLVAKSAYDRRTNHYTLTEQGAAELEAGRDRLGDALGALDEADTEGDQS